MKVGQVSVMFHPETGYTAPEEK